MNIKRYIKDLKSQRWALGFVRGGMQSVMDGVNSEELIVNSSSLQVDWVKMPEDRWFADPFVLDVTEDEILLLVEDCAYATRKGVISLLHINRATMEIVSRKVLVEQPYHQSFPAIWRKDGHIYIYPESAHGMKLDMYEYHPEKEELTLVQTICDDVVWDSYITEAFGEPLMFTASKNDYQLDIYRWNEEKNRFVSDITVPSENPNSRLGGAIFEYKGGYYYPAQDCSKVYGGAIDIKRIIDNRCIDDRLTSHNKFCVEVVKHLESPHPKYPLGIHTLNEYKGVVVIDVLGYKYGWIGSTIAKLVKFKKKLRK